MRDFTIVLCSRKREKYLIDCLEHIEKNSKTDVEVLVGCDLDDKHYLEISDSITDMFPFVKMIFRKRCNSVQDYLNFLARSSNSRYIFVLNDDLNIVSKSWDLNAKKILDGFGPLVYGKTFDNSVDKVVDFYTGFPIISKEAVERLGFVLIPTYENHGADLVTARIYHIAGKVVDLKGIVNLDHKLHNSIDSLKLKDQDQTNKEMISRTYGANFSIQDLLTCDISEYVRKLND